MSEIVPSDHGLLMGDDSHPGWHIDSDKALLWAGDRQAEYSRDLDRIKAMADEAVAKVRAWEAEQMAKVARAKAYLEAETRMYLEQHKDELLAGSKKTFSTPSWEAKWRTNPARLIVLDKEELGKWLEEHPEYARIKLEPDMKRIQELGKQGLCPPGTDWKGEEETLTLVFKDPLLPELKP